MSEIVEFPIHFDVPENYISVENFVEFSKDIEIIINEFNYKLLVDSTAVKVVVLPSSEGSFKGKWGVSIFIGSALVGGLNIINLDTSKAFSRGLTGHEPEYYFELAGTKTRNGASFLVDATKGFLEKNSNELSEFKKEEFPNACKAKNDFYKSCLKNKEIAAIGFTCSDDFPIKREEFIYKISEVIDEKELDSDYDIRQLRIVTSVNTAISRAQWRLQDVDTREFFSAFLKDKDFEVDFLKNGKYPLKADKGDDVIIAKIEYKIEKRNGEIKIKETNIVKVYKFNDISISEVPKNTKVVSVDRTQMDTKGEQLNFIDSLRKK